MNERIKKLAEQYKDEIRDGFDGWEVVHWNNVEDLIQDVIRECIDKVNHFKNTSIAKEVADGLGTYSYSYEGGCIVGMDEAILIIKKHFGIE